MSEQPTQGHEERPEKETAAGAWAPGEQPTQVAPAPAAETAEPTVTEQPAPGLPADEAEAAAAPVPPVVAPPVEPEPAVPVVPPPPSPFAESSAEPPPNLDTGPAVVGPADRPEVAVGAAFAGGFVVAMILKRLAR